MATAGNSQAGYAGGATTGQQIPVRQISHEEWETVPRTIPNFWVAAATWLPLVALVVFVRSDLLHSPYLDTSFWNIVSFSMVATVLAMIFGGGRQAPWMGLGLGAGIYFLLAPAGDLQRILAVALAYFLLLALAVGVLDGRLRRQLRTWKREAAGGIALAQGQERDFGIFKQMSPTVWNLALGALIYPLLRLGWELISTEVHSLHDLDAGYRLDVLGALVLLGISFLISLLRWLRMKSMGLFALEIPADPHIGPISLQVYGEAILVETEETANCLCRHQDQNGNKKAFVDPRFIFCSETCPVHGVHAVNQLDQAEFLAIAAQPWVYGENMNGKLLEGTGQRLVIAGLSGWDSRPVPVRAAWLFGGGKQASAYYTPTSAREPLNRAKRRLSVQTLQGNSITADIFENNEKEELDRIDLRPVGINAQVVRVRGGRPFLI
ncbi:hypothetical protein ACTXL8_00320 [Glutamicibacter arilaitensis]|uniref:hypothetical protein n=1 Tax=Glutamicibacter arilaitensis TaxID=256701 RepID=UPI003FCF3851